MTRNTITKMKEAAQNLNVSGQVFHQIYAMALIMLYRHQTRKSK